jgi:hypothetical protein
MVSDFATALAVYDEAIGTGQPPQLLAAADRLACLGVTLTFEAQEASELMACAQRFLDAAFGRRILHLVLSALERWRDGESQPGWQDYPVFLALCSRHLAVRWCGQPR